MSLLIVFSGLLFAGSCLLLLVRQAATRQERLKRRIGYYLNLQIALAGEEVWRPEQAKGERAKLQQLLAQAGFNAPAALSWLLAAKLVGAAVGFFLWFGLSAGFDSSLALAQAVAAIVIGGIAPEWWLRRRGQKILQSIRASLADTVDLMVICLEAGMTTEKSLARISDELIHINVHLAQQLHLVATELRILPDHSQVFQRFKWRVPLKEIEQWVFSIEQAARFGSPLGPVLRDFSSDLRQRNALRIEERLAKIPARMGLPLMLLILLPLVVLIAGPAVISLMTLLQE